MSRPQNSFEPHHDPKNGPVEPKKAQNDPQSLAVLPKKFEAGTFEPGLQNKSF